MCTTSAPKMKFVPKFKRPQVQMFAHSHIASNFESVRCWSMLSPVSSLSWSTGGRSVREFLPPPTPANVKNMLLEHTDICKTVHYSFSNWAKEFALLSFQSNHVILYKKHLAHSLGFLCRTGWLVLPPRSKNTNHIIFISVKGVIIYIDWVGWLLATSGLWWTSIIFVGLPNMVQINNWCC